jgi:hypothetical protein
MRQIVAFMAALPMAQVSTGQAQLAAVIFYYGVLLLFPFLKMQSRLGLWCVLFAMSFVIMLCTLA